MGSSGFRADPTVRCGRHSEWRSVGEGIRNDDAGSSCGQRTVEGHGTWCWSRVPFSIIVEFATCTAQAIVFGGIKDRIARVSTGMSKGVYMEGLCQVSPLQHSRLLRFQSCSFLCADSCEAMLIVCYLLCHKLGRRGPGPESGAGRRCFFRPGCIVLTVRSSLTLVGTKHLHTATTT